jgi:hypothetical protein
MVVTLYYYWASPQYGILDQDGRNTCRRASVEEFRRFIQSGGVESLIKILNDEHADLQLEFYAYGFGI